jgi:type I restriction enzyme M protein
MLSPQLRNKVHKLWTLFWSAGLTNPLVAIEQITYLLFLKQLEALDAERVRRKKISIYDRVIENRSYTASPDTTASECRWSYIKQSPSIQHLNEVVFPWLRGLEQQLQQTGADKSETLVQTTGRLTDAYFVLDPNKANTLTGAVELIEDLFRAVGTLSANSDIMGDIFEHLLDEIQSSGKNGQFRTPRHIARFMVELLDPPMMMPDGKRERPTRVLDPSCGTAGFLLNTLMHWRKETTASNTLVLEWDGTPHRAYGDGSIEKLKDKLNDCFTGYDNDRTMVRIGWMNLILHGLDAPRIAQRDSLSKRTPPEESGTYDFILANPPFTGSVDDGDLRKEGFPRGKGEKPLTTKSELLFVWLILDLLRVGGRAAVVVPDGVLFGSTNAHRELRRQLLFDNTLEAVISLPAGVFLPYAGVKTSILMFQKVETPENKSRPGEPPRTNEVFFYEVVDEAFSLDQKRNPQFGKDNDLWDALEKIKAWRQSREGSFAKAFEKKKQTEFRETALAKKYFQPTYWKQRWHVIDDHLIALFPELSSQKGHTLDTVQLFGSNANALSHPMRRAVDDFLSHRIRHVLREAADKLSDKEWNESTPKLIETVCREFSGQVAGLVRDEKILDRDFDQFGWNELQRAISEFRARSLKRPDKLRRSAEELKKAAVPSWAEIQPKLREIVRQFAKLDGYEVWVCSPNHVSTPGKRIDPLGSGDSNCRPVQMSWAVPVRAWAPMDDFGEPAKGKKREPQPTHDQNGNVRTEYLDWLRDKLHAFNENGTVKDEHRDRLDPACLEAADFNLSASRHKPFTFESGTHRPPAELIRELEAVHIKAREHLNTLLAMVEDHQPAVKLNTRAKGAKHLD